MTQPLTPLSTFEELRRVAIGYAQNASGQIWTDYNVHDPGVTLLEQTCFALSQLAYQTALPDRDLLTNPKKQFLFREIGMAHPRKVLRTAPVTRADLEAWLSTCDDVEGVVLEQNAGPGCYDMVIFGGKRPAETLENLMRDAFESVRPLGSMLNKITVARRVDVVLTGEIEIAGGVLPEVLAAEIYHTVRGILSGHTHEVETARGATRADIYDAPELLFDLPQKPGVRDLTLENHLGAVRKIPGVREIEHLAIRHMEPVAGELSGPLHLNAVLPTHPGQIELTLTVNGAPMVIDPARLREDFIRIRAERLGHTHHHIAAADWNVLRAGRRRKFDLSHVDALLPVLYQAAGHRPDVDPDPLLAQYRAVIDDVLQSMGQSLADLPTTFHSGAPANLADPAVYRARLALLDYFLALQGLEMPPTQHTGLHSYRGTKAKNRFELDWRAQMLWLAPELNATRGTAPGPNGPGGFLASVAVLCDLDLAVETNSQNALGAYGLTLRKGAPLAERPKTRLAIAREVDDLLDLLPAEDPDARAFEPEDFARYAPFIANGQICPRHFNRLADPMAIRVVPMHTSFSIIADFDTDEEPWLLGTIYERNRAYHIAARIRETWRSLHRRCETVRLIESKPGHAGPPNTFDPVLVIPGWTYRCRKQSFRDYVATQVSQLAPAHLYINIVWQPCPSAVPVDADGRQTP